MADEIEPGSDRWDEMRRAAHDLFKITGVWSIGVRRDYVLVRCLPEVADQIPSEVAGHPTVVRTGPEPWDFVKD